MKGCHIILVSERPWDTWLEQFPASAPVPFGLRVLGGGDCLVHCRMFSGIPALNTPDVIPNVTTRSVPSYCHMSPWVGVGSKIAPLRASGLRYRWSFEVMETCWYS